MSKSSFQNNKVFNKSNIALFCILGMMVGFLVSLVVLSICTFLFGINALWGTAPKAWLKNKWWLLGVLWVALYAVTYFWSADTKYWGVGLQVKLPFLLLPLAIAYQPRFTAQQLQTITLIMAGTLMAGAAYSISFLIRNPVYYINQYRVSHLLPTPAEQDHVRFSLVIALFVIWSVYTWPTLQAKGARWFIGISVGLLAIYLHVLAAKSGLVALYLFVCAWGIYLMIIKKKITGVIIVVAIPLSMLLAIRFIPTFGERQAYMYFSYLKLKDKDKSGNYGDISRLISYKIATWLIERHPISGVGTGDMKTEMEKGYDQWYPATPPFARLIPHNQFLVVALGCGIPAMLLFVVWVFIPLAAIRRNRASFFFFVVWFMLFIQLMIEPIFEVQIGVWVYLFFLSLFKHELPGVKNAAEPDVLPAA